MCRLRLPRTHVLQRHPADDAEGGEADEEGQGGAGSGEGGQLLAEVPLERQMLEKVLASGDKVRGGAAACCMCSAWKRFRWGSLQPLQRSCKRGRAFAARWGAPRLLLCRARRDEAPRHVPPCTHAPQSRIRTCMPYVCLPRFQCTLAREQQFTM